MKDVRQIARTFAALVNRQSKVIITNYVYLGICCLSLLLCRALCQEATAIRPINPGFEADPVTKGWEVNVYGAPSRQERDTKVFHEDSSSLRISADSPSDTALGQEITLKPGGCYRLRGWIKTENLDPHGAPVYGTFQVQRRGGAGILASGVNHAGSTDWAETIIPFLAPADGRVRICVFFVGFGKGTGTAWFDGLRLEEVDMQAHPITVAREPLCPGQISPFQYGQFIEYLCNLVPGMWPEKLYDGSFEGLSPYKFAYLRATDNREKPWYPCGAVNRADLSLDKSTKISGAVSQKIAVPGGAPCTVGIAQDGISVERGAGCLFSCWMRAAGITGAVSVRLHHNGKEYAAHEFHPGGEWQKVTARLAPSETDADTTLTITFRGPGTLWLDNASLMPENSVGGWRGDVVEAVRALKPGIIRFGGSALDDSNLGEFSWRDTIGDPDRRTPFRAWGGLQPTGPGLEEIVQFCHAVGAEPLICVRIMQTTPEDAAEQVQYFNGAVNTPMGALRAKHGHPEPYNIRFWQVGNERSGTEYEARLPAFCTAMRRADPSIRLLSSYPTAGVLRGAGDQLDYVCPHHYSADLPALERDFRAVRHLIETQAPGRPIRVAVTEWNTTAGDWGPGRAMLWNLDNALACSRYQNLMHRNCDLVEIANRSNLTNSFCSGIIQTDNHRLYKTPTYYAQQLYATLAGDHPLKIESELPANLSPDISATLSKDGTTLTLFAVNQSGSEIVRLLDLSALGINGEQADVWTLADRHHAGEPDATNSFDEPERIVPVRSLFHAPAARFTYRFPPYTLTVLRWRMSGARAQE